MKSLLVLIFLCPLSLISQADIYSESDIAFQSLFFDALLAKQKGDTEGQIKALKEIIRQDKTSHSAYYELGKVYVKEKDLEAAEKYAQKAIQNSSNNEWYLLLLAEIQEASGQYAKAAISYNSLISLNPEKENLYHRLALCQLNNKKPNDAAGTLEKLQLRSGVKEETSRRLFEIYSNAGQEDQAVATLKKLCALNPENIRYLNNLAGYLHDIGRKTEAAETFDKVLELDPDNALANMAVTKNTTANMSDRGSYLQSLFPLIENQNIPLDNKIRELMPYLSRIEKDSEDSNLLLDMSELLIDQYSNDAKVYSVRGDVLFYNARFEEAEKNYKKAISIDDRKYTLWDQWMISLWQLEDYEGLETVSYDAMDLFPNQVQAVIMHALSLSINGKRDEALDMVEEAHFIAGGNSLLQSVATICQIWIENKGDIETALELIEKQNISNPVIYEIMGDIYQRNGNSEMSKKCYQESIKMGASESYIKKKMGA